MKFKDARSLPAVAQEDLRRKAVEAVRGGQTQTEVARLFGVSRGAVNQWVRRWEEEGSEGLRAQRRGRPPRPRLIPQLAARAVRTILTRCPDQLRLPFALWTREAVRELLARRLGVRVSVWTVGRYLKAWGMTPQKPLRRAYEQDPAAVRRWLEQEYRALRERARRGKAEMHWGDERGLRSDHQAGRSYGRRGQTPVIPGTGQRFGCNLISTITNRGRLAFMVFHGKFNAAVFLRFLRRLVRLRRGKRIMLIVDGHPVHRSAQVKRWLEQPRRQVEMVLLPGYSPELNPDEMLNQEVKSNAVARARPHDAEEMIENLRSYLHGTQKRPDIVRRYF